MTKRRLPPPSLLAGAILAIAATGCASIVHGTKQEVKITSTPAQAEIIIRTSPGDVEAYRGATPTSVKLPRKNSYQVIVKMGGYQDGRAFIDNSAIDGWFFGNLACGGILGLIIDYSNGAGKKLEPDEINVTLATAQTSSGEEIFLVLRALDADGNLRNLVVPMVRL